MSHRAFIGLAEYNRSLFLEILSKFDQQLSYPRVISMN